ncbi:MAG TPA: 4Fe-4S binding protein, partial [Burkholderiales bacterium]|nr:4Fe-4S binding protein [Burkholderiales bacterium]
PFLAGLALFTATVPILTYMTIGAVWCGWACPQNLLSEWASNLTFKLLGKRADMRVDGEGMIVAPSKNKTINWAILGANLLAVSMVLAFVALMFFYTPSDMWTFLTSESSRQTNMLVMYFFATFLIFIDIGVVRYFFCDYACLYRMGHRLFKTRDALHVSYDASRSSDCAKCNYCATSCITSIQPTNITAIDACIDCGECIDACNRLHVKSGTAGLLSFELGEKGGGMTWGEKLARVYGSFNWLVGALFLLGCAMMAWGIATQKVVNEKKLMLEQQKIQRVAHVCNEQCASIQATCSGKNIAGCYRASACKCACSLEQDPSNALAASWRQCVRNSNAHIPSGSQKQ